MKVRDVLTAVSRAGPYSEAQILGPRRDTDLVEWRQAAHYIAAEGSNRVSLPQVGRVFNRDHTTILHSRNKVRMACGDHPVLKKVAAVRRQYDRILRERSTPKEVERDHLESRLRAIWGVPANA